MMAISRTRGLNSEWFDHCRAVTILITGSMNVMAPPPRGAIGGIDLRIQIHPDSTELATPTSDQIQQYYIDNKSYQRYVR